MNSRYVLQLTDEAAFVARYERKRRDWARASLAEHGCGFRHLPREPSDLIPLVESISAWIRAEFPEGFNCRLVIPASWCFIHAVDGAIGKNREKAALYEFEQFVPVDLDALTCVVQRIDDESDLVVGTLTEPLRSLLDELERSGVFVEGIFVDALLASGNDVPNSETDGFGFILQDAGHVTITGINSAGTAPAVVRSMVLADGLNAVAAGHVVTAIDTMPNSVSSWQLLDIGGGENEDGAWGVLKNDDSGTTRVSREESIRQLLDAVASDHQALDLRCNSLCFSGRWSSVQRRLSTCVCSLLVLLALIGIKFRVDNAAVGRGIASLQPIRNEIYMQAFPGQLPPPEAALRLRAERIKLEGLTDRGGSKTDVHSGDGLELFEIMHDILEQLPSDLKLSISEVLLDERTLSFTGRTTSHGKAGEVVHALNQIPSITAEPPNTKLRKDKTVDFRINARVERSPSSD